MELPAPRSLPAPTEIRWLKPVPGRSSRSWLGRGIGFVCDWRGGVGPPLGSKPTRWPPASSRMPTPEEVTEDPETHGGQVVDWELQFISLEKAERVRTDFYEGEPFLLTRSTLSGRAFVYVAIPPERLADVEGLIPLERIRVVGRIRTGAAVLTGNPILDLLELTRISRR